jgi:hypothetical protein
MLKRMPPITLLIALMAGIGLTPAASASTPNGGVDQQVISQITQQDPKDPAKTSGPSTIPVDTINGGANIQAGGGTWWLGYVHGCRIVHIYVGLPGRWPVTASVSEVDPYGNEFIGSAWAHVENVAVLSNGFVDVLYCVGWNYDISFDIHLVWG